MPGILHLSNAAYTRHQDWDDNVTGPLGNALRILEDVAAEVGGEDQALPGDREATSDLLASIHVHLREIERDLSVLDDADPDEQAEVED